jgi:transcriptional regulator with XRE-family HTH domain
VQVEQVIGTRMRHFREINALTGEQLGERIGELLERPWSRQAVSAAEAGKRAFTAVELVALAYALETTVSRLFMPPTPDEPIETPSGRRIALHEVVGRRPGSLTTEFAALLDQVDRLAHSMDFIDQHSRELGASNEGLQSSFVRLRDQIERAIETGAVFATEEDGTP